MANLIERNFQLLASMGVRLSPRSVEKLSSLCAGFSSQPNARPPVIEQIQRMAVEIARTHSVFTGESNALRPRTYSSPVDFLDRHSCVGHEMHGDSDCHLNLLVQELVAHFDSNAWPISRSKGHSAIVLLGLVSPKALMQLIGDESPGLVCCLFLRDEDWLSWIDSLDLEKLRGMLVERKIVFRALQSRNMKVDLFSLLRDELFGFVGNSLIVANVADRKTAEILGEFESSFLNGLRAKSGGPCVDEFMMMFHTNANCKRKDFALLSPVVSPVLRPLIVVGSGPSLDESLPDLRLLRDRCLLISAGSSLATLMRAGIRPDFHVHVERGHRGELKNLYQGLLDELNLDDFGDIVALLPTSIDPELPSLYERVLMYGRSAQSPVLAWPALQSALLRHEGPECLSAAFAFAMHLCPKRVFLFGCDLGTVTGSAGRSAGALGRSARSFSLKVPGNLARSAMTSSQMLLQVSYMQAAYAACSQAPEVLNLSNGIRLPFAKSLVSLDIGSSDLAGDAGELSIDELCEAIKAPGFVTCASPFADTQISSAKQWIEQWLMLAERAPSMPSFAFRLQASRLLSKRNYVDCELVYSLFRGSLRDGFWLTAFAVENYCQTSNEVQYCWASFARFLRGLAFEVDAIPSWLGASDR